MNQALTFIRAFGNLAQAGAQAALSQQAAPTGKKKRRRKTAEEECSPCAAMDMVDAARERIREGKL